MSDVKEKDLPKMNDAAYIRALDSNGNPVLISKADLAQVAAELMPVATVEKDGLSSRYTRVVFHEDMTGRGAAKLSSIGSYGYAYLTIVAYDGGSYAVYEVVAGKGFYFVKRTLGNTSGLKFKTDDAQTSLYVLREDFNNFSLGVFLQGTSKPGFNVDGMLVTQEEYGELASILHDVNVS